MRVLGGAADGTAVERIYAVSGDGWTIAAAAADGRGLVGPVGGPYARLEHPDGGEGTYQPVCLSRDGSVAVGSWGHKVSGPFRRPFRWSASGGFEWLPGPAGEGGGTAHAVSADGRITVGRWGLGERGRAYVWGRVEGRDLEELLRDRGIDAGDWRLSFTRGVSADGRRILGRGRPPAPRKREFQEFVADFGGE